MTSIHHLHRSTNLALAVARLISTPPPTPPTAILRVPPLRHVSTQTRPVEAAFRSRRALDRAKKKALRRAKDRVTQPPPMLYPEIVEIQSAGVLLEPFIPKRYLPSEWEIEQEESAETGFMKLSRQFKQTRAVSSLKRALKPDFLPKPFAQEAQDIFIRAQKLLTSSPREREVEALVTDRLRDQFLDPELDATGGFSGMKYEVVSVLSRPRIVHVAMQESIDDVSIAQITVGLQLRERVTAGRFSAEADATRFPVFERMYIPAKAPPTVKPVRYGWRLHGIVEKSDYLDHVRESKEMVRDVGEQASEKATEIQKKLTGKSREEEKKEKGVNEETRA